MPLVSNKNRTFLDDSVCYWRLDQSHLNQVLSDHSFSECPSSEQQSFELFSENYEILHPASKGVTEILKSSKFARENIPQSDVFSENLSNFCNSFAIQLIPITMDSLVRRVTDVKFNWQTKTLQSFLELLCWSSITYATYQYYNDLIFALEIGTFFGAIMSVCDEVVLQFLRGLARVIRNQNGGAQMLQNLGFDAPEFGEKAASDGQEVSLLKNVVFGYLSVLGIRWLWENIHDMQAFALLTLSVCISFVVIAEFFCLWLPTRCLGLTLQQRWTQVPSNWENHPWRSLMEVSCWIISTFYFYTISNCFMSSFQLGTLVAIAACLSSGLEPLPLSNETSDGLDSTDGYFQEQATHADVFMDVAAIAVMVEDLVRNAFCIFK
jgi:hypothetical protein